MGDDNFTFLTKYLHSPELEVYEERMKRYSSKDLPKELERASGPSCSLQSELGPVGLAKRCLSLAKTRVDTHRHSRIRLTSR
jgi:hypothetical protein